MAFIQKTVWKFLLGLLSVVAFGNAFALNTVVYTQLEQTATSVLVPGASDTSAQGIKFSVKASYPADSVTRVALRKVVTGGFSELTANTYTAKPDQTGDAWINEVRAATITYGFGVGTHVIYLRTTTADGLQEDSGQFTLKVTANAAPKVTWGTPAAGTVYLTTSGAANVTITGTASDADSNFSKTELLVDGTVNSSGTSTALAYNKTVSIPVGQHTLQLRATDSMSQTGLSASTSITVKADTAPTISVTAPTANAKFLTAGATASVTVTGTAGDVDGNFDHTDLLIDSVVQSGYTVTTAAYSKSVPLAVGTHTVQLRSYDDLGKFTTSAPVSVTVVANSNPAATMTAPTNGATATYYSGSSVAVTVTGSATDPDAANGDSVKTIDILVDGVKNKTITGSFVSTTVTFNSAGDHTVKLRAYDSFGAPDDSSTSTVKVSVMGPMKGTVEDVVYDVAGLPMRRAGLATPT